MIKVVLDTNVYISALFWKGAPYQIFKKILTGDILNFTSPEILKEIKEKTFIQIQTSPRKSQRIFRNYNFQ